MTNALNDAVTLSRPEFALLGQLGSGESLIEEWVEPLDEMSWAVVFDSLLARGLIAWDPDQAGDVLTADWRPLVEPVIAPIFAVNATASRPDGPANLNAMVGSSGAVEHQPEADGLHRVQVVDRSELAGRLVAMLGLNDGAEGEDGLSVSVLLDQLEAALGALKDTGPEAAEALLPDCPGYVHALAEAVGPNVVEVRQLDDEQRVISATLSWIDGADHGCWTVVPGDASVAVRRVRRSELALQVASALAGAAGSPSA